MLTSSSNTTPASGNNQYFAMVLSSRLLIGYGLVVLVALLAVLSLFFVLKSQLLALVGLCGVAFCLWRDYLTLVARFPQALLYASSQWFIVEPDDSLVSIEISPQSRLFAWLLIVRYRYEKDASGRLGRFAWRYLVLPRDSVEEGMFHALCLAVKFGVAGDYRNR